LCVQAGLFSYLKQGATNYPLKAAFSAVCKQQGPFKEQPHSFLVLLGLSYPPLAYSILHMEFIETPTFTRLLKALLTDDEYRGLQNELVENPACGDVIKGGGGIRKIRYAVTGRGKSGGVRAIYYWVREDHQIYMLLIYPKSKKDTLTDAETAILHDLVKEL
jgi:hypothetical protein